MATTEIHLPAKEIRWTPRLIKRLRGKRTRAEFGELLGVSRNMVSRWETGRARPEAEDVRRLIEIAEREQFLEDWRLTGSMTLNGDLEEAKQEIARLFSQSLERTSRQLRG
jgi:transcriptional regulator with XRE-family HTH domain